MKYHVSWSVIALVASFLGTAQGFARTGLAIETMQPTRFTVPPNMSTPVSIKTIPQATCVLHAEGAVDTGPSLTLFADDEGAVRFHIRPSAESDQAEHVEIDCVAGGKITRFPVYLRPNSSPTADMPAPAAEVKKSRPEALVRPALSNEDALQLVPEELGKRGYPPRPDPEQTPEAFATWLKVVTHPSTFVPSRSVAHPEIKHGPPQATSPTMVVCNFVTTCFYSGWELTTFLEYNEVVGYWHVPAIQRGESNSVTASSLWVGLGGTESGTCTTSGGCLGRLWQAGTDQDSIGISPFPWSGYVIQVTSYYAWTDFPTTANEASAQTIPNFTVNPGDYIYTNVWIGDPASQICGSDRDGVRCDYIPSLSGAYAMAEVDNLSRGEYTTISTCRGSYQAGVCVASAPFPGQTAFWIMERPSICNGAASTCVPSDLADYGQASMTGAMALRTSSGWEYYFGGNGGFSNSLNMWSGGNSGTLLSAVYPLVGTGQVGMWFQWYNFH